LNSTQIEYFLTLAKHMNFTSAARSLYVSQPALSKQIALLEKNIGTSLFYRTSRSVKLTHSGEIMLKAFSSMQNIYENALNEIHKTGHKQYRKVTVGLLDALELSCYLNQSIKCFNDINPNISFFFERHNFSNLINALEERQLDIIFTFSDIAKSMPQFNWKIICSTPCYLVMSKRHKLASLINPKLIDFKNESFYVISTQEDCRGVEFVVRQCLNEGFKPKRIEQTPNIESMIISVENCQGVMIVDKLNRVLSNPNMYYFKINAEHNIFAYWRKDNLNPHISTFVKQLRLSFN
jgi:DNA-binding transcriptional LysR family regulator